MYELSNLAKSMIANLYSKLNGEVFPESQSKNPLFATNVPYMHKVYRNMIKEINETRRQEQRPSQK